MVCKDIAILLKKVSLGEGTYLFIPKKAIVGEYDDCLFYSIDGSEYCYISDGTNILEGIEDCCCGINPIDFCKEKDNNSYIDDYFKSYYNVIYFGKYNEEVDEISVIKIDMTSFLNNSNKEIICDILSIVGDELSSNFTDRELEEFNKKLFVALDIARDSVDGFNKRAKRKNDLEIAFSRNSENGMDALDLYNRTRKVVIGQDEAIKTVVSALVVDDYAKKAFEKNRCLLVGKTGTGKTEIIRTVGGLVNRPFIRTDSTQITVAGYVGGSIENNILIPLIEMADGNLKIAQQGIVALDEIDKKGSAKNDDVAGRGVLNSLLPFLDGTTFHFNYKGKPITFDTSGLSVFALGAFSNIFDEINSRDKIIGFNNSNRILDSTQITFDDFINIGLMPNEFMGRFPITVFLKDLMVPDYEKILTESVNSPILFYKNFFYDKYGVVLNCTDRFIEGVARRAIELERGGRSLKAIVEEAIAASRWEIITNVGKYRELIVDLETVNDNKKYILR